MKTRLPSRVLGLILAAGVMLAGDYASAQPQKFGPSGRPLVRRSPSGGGLGGVKSQAPRPMQSLGGVRSQAPRPIGSPRDQVRIPSGGNRPDFLDPRRGRGGSGDTDDRFRVEFDSQRGFRARGDIRNDDSRFRFDINPGLQGRGDWRHGHGGHGDHDGHNGHGHHGHHDHWQSRWPIYQYWPYADLWGYGSWYDNYDYYEPQQVVGSPVYVVDPSMFGLQAQQQPQQPSTPTPPPTALDRADFALYNGRIDDAVKAYREHLAANPNDADVMRRFAIALVQDRKVKEGVAMMAMAYEKDMLLVHIPLDPRMVAGGDAAFREVLRSTVIFSNKIRSASGYLAVAAIMQGEGREAQALKILEKAKRAGLDEKLAAQFEGELQP